MSAKERCIYKGKKDYTRKCKLYSENASENTRMSGAG